MLKRNEMATLIKYPVFNCFYAGVEDIVEVLKVPPNSRRTVIGCQIPISLVVACTVNPRYEPLFISRLQPGDYPHHFLEACGREWENPSSRSFSGSLTRATRRAESCRQPTMSPPPATFVGLKTGIYCTTANKGLRYARQDF